jgi:hypothetical protein
VVTMQNTQPDKLQITAFRFNAICEEVDKFIS